jgi:hypothetical protein
LADLLTRIFVEQNCGESIPQSGPYTVLMALFRLYAVFFPTVWASWFGVNEKVTEILLIWVVAAIDDVRSELPVAVGFVVFLFTAPLLSPVSAKSS